MNLDDLKKPFDPRLISWRVGATNKKKRDQDKNLPFKGIALAYIDARDVMERLDSVCGAANWQNTHPHANGKTSCRIGIKIGDEWVWKENGAGDSAMDAEKGAFSDSFKRAAVLWGIGQYLYNVPNIWVELDDWGAIKNPNDIRLKKALEDAAKGIRYIEVEPEPEVKKEVKPEPKKEEVNDFTQAELEYLLNGIEACTEFEDFKGWVDNALAAKDRIKSDTMHKAIKTALDEKQAHFREEKRKKENVSQ